MYRWGCSASCTLVGPKRPTPPVVVLVEDRLPSSPGRGMRQRGADRRLLRIVALGLRAAFRGYPADIQHRAADMAKRWLKHVNGDLEVVNKYWSDFRWRSFGRA